MKKQFEYINGVIIDNHSETDNMYDLQFTRDRKRILDVLNELSDKNEELEDIISGLEDCVDGKLLPYVKMIDPFVDERFVVDKDFQEYPKMSDVETGCFYHFVDSVENVELLCDRLNFLMKEKEVWKLDSCQNLNRDSILSMDIQIVQESIFELEQAIKEEKDIEQHFYDLKKKFDDLINHRLDRFPEQEEDYDEEEIIGYLRAYHGGDVNELKNELKKCL